MPGGPPGKNVLIYTMGKEVEHILKAFTFPEGGEEDKYAKIIEKFDHRNLYFVDTSIDLSSIAGAFETKAFKCDAVHQMGSEASLQSPVRRRYFN